jgi:branched-chain amino acid transport system permease protein
VRTVSTVTSRARAIVAAGRRRLSGFPGWSRFRSLPFAFQLVMVALLSMALPIYGNDYLTSIGVSILTFALLGLGLNIVMGFAGLLDLGYAAFFAIGAYTTAILTTKFGVDFWWTLVPATAAAGIAGYLLGYPTLRLRSDYLAIVTLAFGEIVRSIFTNWAYVGGPNGIYNIPPPSILGVDLISQSSFYVIGVTLVVTALYLIRNLSLSPVGRGWIALREDESAAEAVGVPTLNLKLLAYSLGGMLGGLAGAFFAARLSAIDPTSFTFALSSQIVILIIIGGLGSLGGVVLGALVVVALPEALRVLEQSRFLIMAAALIVIVMFRPQGLWPENRSHRAPFDRLGPPDPDEEPNPMRFPPLMSGGEPILRVQDLVQHFGGVKAVDGVTFDVRMGEILSVIGPNGAGKTTLFNCITGVQRAKAGNIVFNGSPITSRKPHAIVRLGMARTFQNIRLFKQMAVFENVMVGATIGERIWSWRALFRHRPDRGDERRALEASRYWLRFVGLERRAGMLATQLSYADQRRVEIARALASSPSLILLDEPAAGMDPTEKLNVMAMVRDIRSRGVTVVLIDHDMSLIMNVSDRVIVLDRGRVIAEGTPSEIQNDERVIDAYLGSEEGQEEDADADDADGVAVAVAAYN